MSKKLKNAAEIIETDVQTKPTEPQNEPVESKPEQTETEKEEEEEIDEDVKSYEVLKKAPIYPFLCEKEVIKGVFYQLSLVARDIFVLPLSFLDFKSKSAGTKYARTVFISLLLTFLILNAFGATVTKIFTWQVTQKYYKLWAIYTVLFISNKYVQKLQIYAHSAIRGGIRTNSSMIGPIITNILANIYVYFHQMLVVGTFVSGIGGKAGYFFNAVMHAQIVKYKKFIPKSNDGTPMLSESLLRIVMIISVLLMVNKFGFAKEALTILMFEIFSALGRFFLAGMADDGQELLEKLKKGTKKASEELSGIENESINDSIFISSKHEALALIFGMLVMHVEYRMKVVVLISLAFIALCSTVDESDEDEEEEEIEEEEEEESSEHVVEDEGKIE